jgi:phospholipid/cholesterol/gamma-HCH transport system permease protein
LKLPENWKAILDETGNIGRFTGTFFVQVFKARFELTEFLRQCFIIGYQSLGLVGLTGFIMGLVLTLQVRPIMLEYGVEAKIPAMVALSIIREIGPMITALIFSGKIGSSIGAELGSMKVTEQIDAMDVSGTNPYKYLVVTRVLACTLMLPVLVLLSDAIGLYGSFVGINIHGSTSFQLFYKQVFDALLFADVIPAFLKTFVFGFAIGLIGCFKGFYSSKGTEGVGKSANSAVVLSSVIVFILDLIAVQITDLLNLN